MWKSTSDIDLYFFLVYTRFPFIVLYLLNDVTVVLSVVPHPP
jgi:hypothetical protein